MFIYFGLCVGSLCGMALVWGVWLFGNHVFEVLNWNKTREEINTRNPIIAFALKMIGRFLLVIGLGSVVFVLVIKGLDFANDSTVGPSYTVSVLILVAGLIVGTVGSVLFWPHKNKKYGVSEK